MTFIRMLAFTLVSVAASSNAMAPPSPYVGEQTRHIKALSDDEIDGLLKGKGSGFAKAAELNGYPGPAHVLELASELGLSSEQRRATEAIHSAMQAKASQAGAALVAKERELDQSFARRTIDTQALNALLQGIGELQAEIRTAHLEAHLAQARVLTTEQSAHYFVLRGYSEHSPPAGGSASPHHH